MTYPAADVVHLLNDRFVCFRPQIDRNKDLARRLGVQWTPGLVWLDEHGTKHHENVGFFEPEEHQAECAFGAGRVAAGTGAWPAARQQFEQVATRWPRSFAAPAALYWAGAAAMMATGKSEELRPWWDRLLRDHADSSWAMKVGFLEKK